MNRKLLLLLICLLAGCGLKNTKPGDGREWLQTSCSGFADWTKCHETAQRYCPEGYDIANQEESMITQGRTMLFACKGAVNKPGKLLPK